MGPVQGEKATYRVSSYLEKPIHIVAMSLMDTSPVPPTFYWPFGMPGSKRDWMLWRSECFGKVISQG